MPKQALGRDLGTLLGRDLRQTGAGQPAKPDPAPLGAGVRSLVEKPSPSPAPRAPAIPRWYLLAGDIVLVSMALITILKSPHPLSLGAEIFSIATVLLAAILGIVALLMPASEHVLKIDRERDCERGGVDGEARRGRIFERNLRPRSNEASRPAPPQDRPI